MIAALKTGGVDAAHVSEPLATIAVDAQAAVKFKPVNTYAPNGLTVAVLQFGTNLLGKIPRNRRASHRRLHARRPRLS